MNAPLVAIWLRSVTRLNARARAAEARALVLEMENAELVAEVIRLAEDNEVLRARVAVLADLADPNARSLAASVLKTIERL